MHHEARPRERPDVDDGVDARGAVEAARGGGEQRRDDRGPRRIGGLHAERDVEARAGASKPRLCRGALPRIARGRSIDAEHDALAGLAAQDAERVIERAGDRRAVDGDDAIAALQTRARGRAAVLDVHDALAGEREEAFLRRASRGRDHRDRIRERQDGRQDHADGDHEPMITRATRMPSRAAETMPPA